MRKTKSSQARTWFFSFNQPLNMNRQVDLLIKGHVKTVTFFYKGFDFLASRKSLWIVGLNLLIEKGIVFSFDLALKDTLGKVRKMGDKSMKTSIFPEFSPAKMKTDNV